MPSEENTKKELKHSKTKDFLGRMYSTYSEKEDLSNIRRGNIKLSLDFPVSRSVEVSFVRFLSDENNLTSFSEKQYGVINEEMSREKEKDGKEYFYLKASFYNKGKIETIIFKVDLTELKEIGADLDKVTSMIFVADKEGRVLYLPPQFDENVLKWAEKENKKDYVLRKDIIGKYNLLSYIKGKEKKLASKIFDDVKKGETIITETNVPPDLFRLLQCKSKEMTHVINIFHSDGDLLFQFSINVSDISQEMWELYKEKAGFSNLKLNTLQINSDSNYSLAPTYVAFMNLIENFMKHNNYTFSEKDRAIIFPFLITEEKVENTPKEEHLLNSLFSDFFIEKDKEKTSFVEDNIINFNKGVGNFIDFDNPIKLNGKEYLSKYMEEFISSLSSIKSLLTDMEEVGIEDSVLSFFKKKILEKASFLNDEVKIMQFSERLKGAIRELIYDEAFISLTEKEKTIVINKLLTSLTIDVKEQSIKKDIKLNEDIINKEGFLSEKEVNDKIVVKDNQNKLPNQLHSQIKSFVYQNHKLIQEEITLEKLSNKLEEAIHSLTDNLSLNSLSLKHIIKLKNINNHQIKKIEDNPENENKINKIRFSVVSLAKNKERIIKILTPILYNLCGDYPEYSSFKIDERKMQKLSILALKIINLFEDGKIEQFNDLISSKDKVNMQEVVDKVISSTLLSESNLLNYLIVKDDVELSISLKRLLKLINIVDSNHIKEVGKLLVAMEECSSASVYLDSL